MGKQWKQLLTLFFGAPKSLQMVIAAMKLKDTYSLEGKLWPTSVQFSSVAQSCLTLCDPMNGSMPSLPVHHQLPELTQIHVHRVSNPSHPLSSPSPSAPNPSKLQSLFQWVNSRQHIKKQTHYFVNKGPSSQGYGFSSSHVRMWELDYKESWAQKN